MRIVISILAMSSILLFQNCSKPAFNEVAASAGQVDGTKEGIDQVSNNLDDSIDGAIPVQNLMPRLSVKINPCTANTWCYVDYELTEAFSQKVSFDWLTNDQKYLEDATKYARPNVNYVPATGNLVFYPGEKTKRIQIKALSGFTQILLPFLWRNCKVNDVATPCSSVLK